MKKYKFPIYVTHEEWKRKYVWLKLIDNKTIKVLKSTYKKWIGLNKIILWSMPTFECDARAKADYFSVGGSDF